MPPIRTFKPRRRPLTAARAEQLDRLGPMWCLSETGELLDPVGEFRREAPLVLDIGIGLGDTFVAMAVAQPDVDVIGVDVHTPGIAATVARLASGRIVNARLVHGDALVFLDRIRPASLHGIRAFFPDPWPKARHRHRRLVREPVVDRLVARLAPAGWLHLATDIEDYALQMDRVCAAHPALIGGVVGRPADRPVTRYERKGLAAGRSVTDLVFRVVN